MPNSHSISRIQAREVFDSRGNPTVEVEVHLEGGARGRAIVPSGASTGRHEARELRDGDLARYGGKGVRRAVANVHEQIAPRLLGLPASDQALIDRTLCTLDGTADKARLGANAILGVSLACAHAAADARKLPLWRYLLEIPASGGYQPPVSPASGGCQPPRMPLPMVNLISGGLHAGGNLDFQDFLLLPIGARSYSEALEMTVKVYRALSEVLVRSGFDGVLVGDEGGYGPRLESNERAVEVILEAIERAGFTPGRDAALAVDVAATHFYREGRYHLAAGGGKAFETGVARSGDRATTRGSLAAGGGKTLDWVGMAELLTGWVERYPILSIEDGMAEDDWEGWRKLTEALGRRVQLIGDDLFVTNRERLQRGIETGVANSVLVKLNQVGTLTETLEVIALARSAGYRPVISARSGETEDNTIADLAVATGAGQIKIGSVARGERLAKYNQLLRIEEELGAEARFAGWEDLVNV